LEALLTLAASITPDKHVSQADRSLQPQ